MLETIIEKIKALSNENLVSKMSTSWNYEKRLKSIFLIYINEVYERKLYAEGPYPTMFSFLTTALGLSEPTASKRLSAARLARKIPELYDLIENGDISITAASMISRVVPDDMSAAKIRSIIDRSRKKSIRQIEIDLSEKNPSSIKSKDYVRFGSTKTPKTQPLDKQPMSQQITNQQNQILPSKEQFRTNPESSSQKPSLIQNSLLFPEDDKPTDCSKKAPDQKDIKKDPPKEDPFARISFTAPKKVYEDLCRAKEILSHKYPKAQMADIFSEVLEFFLKHKDPNICSKKENNPTKSSSFPDEGLEQAKEKSENQNKPSSITKPEIKKSSSKSLTSSPKNQKSRYIPQQVKHQVYQRDGGQCSFKDSEGRRCCARTMLEYDHIIPWGMGGSSVPQNIRLLCKTHNLLMARRFFGEEKIKDKISKSKFSHKPPATFFAESPWR